MESETLVHQSNLSLDGEDYEILVFSRPDGSHVAKTFFATEDVIINDGASLDEALDKHRRLLPLAVDCRQCFRPSRRPL
ncbi:MAG: hypothetical protein C0617_13365 [Desulfuromonas sp.]|uniref:hypothetical protein n=1 Tax=Desulfuromonas sp. TaxID=892 RepID=UPI000CAF8A9F|nr:hypothetical protein [Desulfuromonas sp.]PLX82853.1 MAG: hypothetical protein C0617_13365 [Desulfuromonas sp.]